MKLGTYVEIKLKCKNIDDSLRFYEYLGFRKLGDDVLTDGSINIRLSEESFSSPVLNYMGTDAATFSAIFKNQAQAADEVFNAEFKSLNGLTVAITREKSKVKMPAGTPTTRAPLSRLGKFGEFSIPVRDVAKAVIYWSKLGFEPLHIGKIPYAYSIVSDGAIVLGLHGTRDFDRVTLTYFASDMQKRVETFGQEGLNRLHPLRSSTESQIYENAAFESPDGQQFFLFKGEV